MHASPSPLRLAVLTGMLLVCMFAGAPLLVLVSLGVLTGVDSVLVLTNSSQGWP
ncbi:hypothetical protein [Rhodococcoides fascians]|uniref:hypothetical protein n=1 Tax=Rhodococcoides fascians TaxID=1828 RepID=UPI000A7BC824|nr:MULTISPECIES: hypothetical protein [Rhodococcus]